MNLVKKLQEIFPNFSKECILDFYEASNIKSYRKGELVIREGQYSKKAFLILVGCSRAYYIKDGKDISDWFAFENEFMTSIVSFFSEKPSPHYVEFIEESLVMEFSKDTVSTLSNKYLDFERMINLVVVETMIGLCERLHTVQFAKSHERYDSLLNIYPNIEERISLTHIASYLGITLETLSRIRKELSFD